MRRQYVSLQIEKHPTIGFRAEIDRNKKEGGEELAQEKYFFDNVPHLDVCTHRKVLEEEKENDRRDDVSHDHPFRARIRESGKNGEKKHAEYSDKKVERQKFLVARMATRSIMPAARKNFLTVSP